MDHELVLILNNNLKKIIFKKELTLLSILSITLDKILLVLDSYILNKIKLDIIAEFLMDKEVGNYLNFLKLIFIIFYRKELN